MTGTVPILDETGIRSAPQRVLHVWNVAVGRVDPVLDLRARPIKERLLGGVAHRLAGVVSPNALTGAALVVTVGAAGAASAGLTVPALLGWWLGRLLDGLDGPVARARGTASDFGGYLDVLADTVGYIAIPLGVAAGVDSRAAWVTVAVLLGVFWLNGLSWTYLAAILEKRGAGAQSTGEMTTVTMPPALIEGTETIVLFSLFIVFAPIAPWLFSAMAALVLVNVVQRLWWARGALAPPTT